MTLRFLYRVRLYRFTEAAYLNREREAGVAERLMGGRSQDYQTAKASAFDGDQGVAALADRIRGGFTRSGYSDELRARGLIGIGGTASATEKQQMYDRWDAASAQARGPGGSGGWGILAAAIENAGKGGTATKAGGGGSGGSAFGRDALGGVVKSLRLSIGPKATISGLESVGRSAQIAALNNDPLDRTLEELQLKALERIEKTLSDRLPRGAAPSERPGLGGGK